MSMNLATIELTQLRFHEMLKLVASVSYSTMGVFFCSFVMYALYFGLVQLKGITLIACLFGIGVTLVSVVFSIFSDLRKYNHIQSVFDRRVFGEIALPKIWQAVLGVTLWSAIGTIIIWQVMHFEYSIRMLIGFPLGLVAFWMTPRVGRFASLINIEKKLVL